MVHDLVVLLGDIAAAELLEGRRCLHVPVCYLE